MNKGYLIAGGGVLATLVLAGIISWIALQRKSKTNPNLAPGHPGSNQSSGVTFDSEFVLSTIEDGVVMVGTDNVIHLFNPAAGKITSWPPDQASGLEYHSVLTLTDEHGTAYPADVHPFSKSLKTNVTVKDSHGMIQTRNGKLIPISLIVSPLQPTPNGTNSGVVGVFRDITEEREEEKRRTDFISTASHEMRTPIASIEGYLSLALNEKVSHIDDRAKGYLLKAHDATKHLGQLFQDLLTSSKAEDGRLVSNPTVIEAGELLKQVCDDAKFGAQKKGLTLDFAQGSNKEVTGVKVINPLYYTYVDPNRMREVVQNLIDNAIKYTNQGGVSLAISGDSNIIQIQIKDTGTGIPEEDIPHLFQKFYRVDNTNTREVGGTGLGLYISRRIVELYDGRIWVESHLGKGSIFFINLPRLTKEQALEKQRSAASTVSPMESH
jgi:PAS domain S-box-containing protein